MVLQFLGSVEGSDWGNLADGVANVISLVSLESLGKFVGFVLPTASEAQSAKVCLVQNMNVLSP